MLFKLLGLHYVDTTTPNFAGSYLSNLSTPNTGDQLVDEQGNPITFGLVVVPYGTEPLDSSLNQGDTKFWFDLTTSPYTIRSKTKNLDDSITTLNIGFSGSANFLQKGIYDSNDDGIVNSADRLASSTQSFTLAQALSHINNAQIHSPLDDAVVNVGYVWSSSKVSTQLATKSNVAHIHPPFDGNTPTGEPSQGFVPVPPAQDETLLLKTDGTWAAIKSSYIFLDQLGDTDVVYPEDYDFLTRQADKWINSKFIASSTVEPLSDPTGKLFWYSTTGIVTQGPVTTTVGYVPSWVATTNVLGNGFAVLDSISQYPSHDNLLSELGVENELESLSTLINEAIATLHTEVLNRVTRPYPQASTAGNLVIWGDNLGNIVWDAGYSITDSISFANPSSYKLVTEHAAATNLSADNVRTVLDANAQLVIADDLVLMSCGVSNRTVTLIDAGTCSGYKYTIKKIDAGVGTVVLAAISGYQGAQTIDGSATYTITNQWDAVTIISDGFNWFIV